MQAGLSLLPSCWCCVIAQEGKGHGERYWFPVGNGAVPFPRTLSPDDSDWKAHELIGLILRIRMRGACLHVRHSSSLLVHPPC